MVRLASGQTQHVANMTAYGNGFADGTGQTDGVCTKAVGALLDIGRHAHSFKTTVAATMGDVEQILVAVGGNAYTIATLQVQGLDNMGADIYTAIAVEGDIGLAGVTEQIFHVASRS